jgi:hypothetical protein
MIFTLPVQWPFDIDGDGRRNMLMLCRQGKPASLMAQGQDNYA